MVPVKAAFQGGLELNFFAQREFESIKDVDREKQAPIIARNALRFLMMGWTQSWTDFINPAMIRAAFLKRDHELLRELRFAFQQGFFELFEQLKNTNLTEMQKEQVHLYLSNCLTLLPYADLTPYESIQIPQYVDSHWELVEYQVKPIELTETTGWQRHFIQEQDRVFAYGLEPLLQRKAESHLIFMGTTYPAGQGFITQINTDSKGFETVGKSLYRTGRDRIQEWLSQQENATHVCGVSLGGSLSLLLAIDTGDYKLSRVDALNPAGLHDAWSKSKYDHWDELPNKPKVVIQKQGNDPVSVFGVWKEDWEILHVIPPKDRQGPNAFYDHFLNYAGFSETQFTYVEAKQDNAKRNGRNFWLYSLGRSLIYYGLLLPYTYIVRPIVSLITQNWLLSLNLLVLGVAIGLACAGILLGLVFLAIAGSLLVGSSFFFTECVATKEKEQTGESIGKEEFAEMHDPALPRNHTMDIYNENNEVDIEFKYREVRTYYQIMRHLKGKVFLPDEEHECKHVKGMSKKTLLEKSLDSQNEENTVVFKVTKAKAAHIRHTLTLVHQLGIENREKLKHAVEERYTLYRIGKKDSS